MTSIAHTPGPWLRVGRTVYALMHAGWEKGEQLFKNRITITVQHDRECSEAEAEACACLVEASPDLLESNMMLMSALENTYYIKPEYSDEHIYAFLPSIVVATAYLAARQSVRKAKGGSA